MLKIIRSGFSDSGKTDAVKEIIGLITKEKGALMIVPEQQTVSTEISLASLLPNSAPLYFEVTNFTRLANTVFRALGGICTEYCDNAKKALIMWRTLTELSPVLDMTRGRREISMGLVESALRAMGELQSLAISADMLEQALESESVKEDRRLHSKLSDITKIYFLYKKILSEKYSDSGDDCEIMAEKLNENPEFLSGHHIYIDGFTSFTEPQYKLIGILSKRAELSVILATSPIHEDFFEHTELKETKDRLIGVARRSGSDIKLINKSNHDQKNAESISLLIDQIWRKNTFFDNITLQNDDEVRIFEAETPFEEANFIAEDIKRRVMEGASFCDFAIIMRDERSYAGILDGALKLCGIPYFSGEKRCAESFELVKLIYSAYSAIRSGYSREDVLTYMKSGLCGISSEEGDLFESYVDTWQLTGKRFTDEVAWNMNPDGYDGKKNLSTDSQLVRINDTRRKLLAPLINLEIHSREAKTVTEQARVLLDFLLELKLQKKLTELAQRLAKFNEVSLAEDELGLWKLITDSLDTLTEVMGDSECTPDGFVDQLKILFSSAAMGKIPAHYDEVTVGQADIIRLNGKKHIYLLGVNDGVFPAALSEASYFTDKDRETLSSVGLNIKPELSVKGARELYIFSRAMSFASRSVTLSYTRSTARFKASEPSAVIKRISELTGGSVIPRRICELSVSERIYSPASALESCEIAENPAVRTALAESGFDDKLKVREGSIDNTDITLDGMSSLVKGEELSLSQSKIDAYVSCPLSYFCKYILKLSPEKKAEFDSSGVGSLIHSILENFFKALSENNMSASEISKEEREDLTRRAALSYLKELSEDPDTESRRTKIKIERLCRAALPVVEGLCEEFSVSKFTPKFFELPISKEDGENPSSVEILSSDGTRTVIGGIIDRVDTYEKDGNIYVRVVDYKTGKKEFKKEDLAEGRNLQMFLYLRSIVESENEEFKKRLGLKEGGRIIPAGAVYLKTFIGDKNIPTPDDSLAESTVKDEQKRLGMILDDEDIIYAMGLKYTPVYSKRSPGKIPDSKRELLYSEEGFGEIMKTVESSVIKVADSMKKGVIIASPKLEKDSSPCDFCDFKAVCRNVRTKNKR